MQRVTYQMSLYSPHENRKKKASVEKEEIMKDGANKMRALKGLTSAKVILNLPRIAAPPTIGHTKLIRGPI